MIEKWNETLRCPQCSNTGTASLSQSTDDEMPTVQDVPDGFEALHTEFGPNFQCKPCGVLVDP
jgi:hypothetical protein